MSSSPFASMNEADFARLINDYIDRAPEQRTELPADIFFDLLLERIALDVNATLTLVVEVEEDQVVITPDREVSDIVVRGNEILIGGHRLIFQTMRRTE